MLISQARSIRFGEFEVDLCAWMLRRNNTRVALQKKPFQILRLLLSRPGELVSRAELAQELWPDLHVSYDHCLNTAVNSLRNALGDPTSESRFIETHPGLGYRFAGCIRVTVAEQNNFIEPDSAESDLTLGRYFLQRGSLESLARGRACFNALVESNRMKAAGYAGLAELENLNALWGWAPTREAAGRGLLHARIARSSDPALFEATVALAVASGLSSGSYDEAMRACSSVLETSPKCTAARIWLGEFLCSCGRAEEAVEYLQRAKQTDPFSLLIPARLSLALYLSGDYEAGVEQAWAALSLERACASAQYALALTYQQLGHTEDAITEFENAVTCSGGDAAALASLCHALHSAGRSAEAVRVAQRLDEVARSSYVSQCWRALVQLASGERGSAEQSLLAAAEAGDCLLGFVRYDPRFRKCRIPPCPASS